MLVSTIKRVQIACKVLFSDSRWSHTPPIKYQNFAQSPFNPNNFNVFISEEELVSKFSIPQDFSNSPEEEEDAEILDASEK